MGGLNIWLARTVPVIMGIVHMAGIAVIVSQVDGEPLGLNLVTAAWVGLIIYTAILYMRGDFIQRALNIKPWLNRDEMQRKSARGAVTATFMTVLCLLGLMIGLHLADVIGEGGAGLASLDSAGRYLFLEILVVAFVGTAMPTAYLGWTLKPLPAEEAEDEPDL